MTELNILVGGPCKLCGQLNRYHANGKCPSDSDPYNDTNKLSLEKVARIKERIDMIFAEEFENYRPLFGSRTVKADLSIDNLHWANLYFDWSQSGIGFGQFQVAKCHEDKDITIDSETMSPFYVYYALINMAAYLVQNAKKIE